MKRKLFSAGMILVLALGARTYAEEAPPKGASDTARVECEQVLASDRAPAYLKSLALLRLAQCYVGEKRYAEAKDAYRKVASLADAPPHHKWESEQALKAIGRIEAGLPPRDPAESHSRSQVQLGNENGGGNEIERTGKPAVTLFIALDGADANAGTREKPFATFGRALEEVKKLKRGGAMPDGGVSICFRKGVYPLKEGLKIGADASGREGAPLVIAGCDGEEVRLSGGVRVRDFRPVDDPAILARLPEESRGKVLVADLKAQGITKFVPLVFRGYSCGSKPSMELFFNGKPMTPARWPNEGFVRTGKVLDPGDLKSNRGGAFEFDGDRPARWRQAHDIQLYGYWFYDWADNTLRVASIDLPSRQIRTLRTSPYGMRQGQSYYVFNLLEEIDKPGEWYLDRETGRLYLYPPSDVGSAAVELSMLEGPLLRIEGASHVTVRGLTFELGAGDDVVINDCEHCLVAGCVARRSGATGVTITGGHDCGVLSCDIYTLGRGGTVITGGDRKTLTPGRHFVENCHIHDFSRVDRTYTPAVQIEGVGNRIAHNLFHDTPCHAIRLEGNDHVVEFNEVHDVVRESDDQGGLDMFLNPSYRGNVLRYNYWHDIGSKRACGQAGIRLDDAISGVLIYGNVFRRCSESQFGAIQIHGGKDNWIDNNIFIDCRFGVSFSPWGKDRWTKFLASDAIQDELHHKVDISAPPYSARYPALARLAEDNDINMVWRNLAYNCGDFLTRDQGIQRVANNEITKQDPGFADAASGNFKLRDDAPIYEKIGFRPIPFDEIGLYDDALRATNLSKE